MSDRPKGALRSYDPLDDIVFCRGAGCQLWDMDGKPYLDFVSGYSANNLGHLHPKLVEAAKSQLAELSFCTGANTLIRQELEHSLAWRWKKSRAMAHDDTNAKVWFCTSGARAVEIAWKVAYANRPGGLMRFNLGYHGRSLATAHISDTNASRALIAQLKTTAKQDAFKMDMGYGLIPFPMCGDHEAGDCEHCEQSLAFAKSWLELHGENISAMLLEPAIGARGYFFAPSSFYRRLVSLVREYGILVISDEIQMGLGRLGALFVSHEREWEADFTVFGKSLGGGIATIAAVIGKSDCMDLLPQGIESETFAGNPFACRIAIESLKLLDDEALMLNVQKLGAYFRCLLKESIPPFATVDGQGLASVVDLSKSNGRDAKGCQVAYDWVLSMKKHGLLAHLTGPNRDRIALIPPLIVEREAVEQAVEIMNRFWKNQ